MGTIGWLATVLLVATPLHAQGAPGDKLYVQAASAALHSGPGVQYDSILDLERGDELLEFERIGPGRHVRLGSDFKEVVYELAESDGEWVHVGVPGATDGWVMAEHVGVNEPLGSASADSGPPLPRYDIEAYCAEVADMVGGSYSIEKGCRDMEAEAKASLEGRVAEPRIMKYCDEVASMTGGSYSMLEGCIDMEEEARDSLSQ